MSGLHSCCRAFNLCYLFLLLDYSGGRSCCSLFFLIGVCLLLLASLALLPLLLLLLVLLALLMLIFIVTACSSESSQHLAGLNCVLCWDRILRGLSCLVLGSSTSTVHKGGTLLLFLLLIQYAGQHCLFRFLCCLLAFFRCLADSGETIP